VLAGKIVGAPDPSSPLKESDTLFVSGSPKDLARVAALR
jgi:K+/H+ antiporter YhaU regulatory subunit KhtT